MFRACLVTTVPFRSATVSTVKAVHGRKWTFCIGERNGTAVTKQALSFLLV